MGGRLIHEVDLYTSKYGSWLEHNSIDLSGGTVRTPANIVCWFLIFYKEIFQVLGGDKSHVCIHFYFLEHQGWVGSLVT